MSNVTNNVTYTLDDSTIAGIMQLLTLAIVTGTNLLDHFRLMELTLNEEGRLIMTREFVEKTEKLANELLERAENDANDDTIVF